MDEQQGARQAGVAGIGPGMTEARAGAGAMPAALEAQARYRDVWQRALAAHKAGRHEEALALWDHVVAAQPNDHLA